MKNKNLILAAIISTIMLSATAFAVTNDSKEKEAKSIAWYTANTKEATKTNKMCFDNPTLQSTTDCKNALHALQLVYVGVGN